MVGFKFLPTEPSLTYLKVHAAFGLSGEPMCAPVASFYGTKQEQYTASQISAINVLKRQYQKEYMEYWNSTASNTGTGRPVDAVISPLAPFAAARPDMYDYYGMYFRKNDADSSLCVAGHNLGQVKRRLNVFFQGFRLG
jgi:amidase